MFNIVININTNTRTYCGKNLSDEKTEYILHDDIIYDIGYYCFQFSTYITHDSNIL